jgi:hypothetical protein
MKSLEQLVCAAVLALGGSALFPAFAATVSITFDEPGISHDTTITSQYTGIGVTFSGTLMRAKNPAQFGNPFAGDGLVLHFDEKPTQANVDLAFDALALSFDYRRPDDFGSFELQLLRDGALVHDFGTILWNSGVWESLTYDGSSGTFDRLAFSAGEKFVIDDLSVTPIPVPAAGLLLFTGTLTLGGLSRLRRA